MGKNWNQWTGGRRPGKKERDDKEPEHKEELFSLERDCGQELERKLNLAVLLEVPGVAG